MQVAVLEIQDTVFRTRTIIDQSRTMLRKVEASDRPAAEVTPEAHTLARLGERGRGLDRAHQRHDWQRASAVRAV